MDQTIDNSVLMKLSYLQHIDNIKSAIGDEIRSLDTAYERNISTLSIDSSIAESIGFFSGIAKYSAEDNHRNKVLERFNSEKVYFLEVLEDARFDEEYENEATFFVERYLNGNDSDTFAIWLQNFFLEYQDNPYVVCQLLRLFICLDFEIVEAPASMIAAACIHNISDEVKDVNLSLLGHWCNKKALDIMKGIEEPSDVWMKIKYNKLKEVITERCTTI